MQELLTESQRQPIPNTEAGRMAQSMAEHREILNGLRLGDAEMACKAMRTHISNTARCAGIELF